MSLDSLAFQENLFSFMMKTHYILSLLILFLSVVFANFHFPVDFFPHFFDICMHSKQLNSEMFYTFRMMIRGIFDF